MAGDPTERHKTDWTLRSVLMLIRGRDQGEAQTKAHVGFMLMT